MAASAARPSAVFRFFDSDLWWSFSRSPVAVLSALVALLCIGGAVLAPWVAPQNPFDLATLNLSDAFKPPAWAEEGDAAFPLGSDDQGRDVFSAILHGARVSLLVGVCAVLFSTLVGVSVGLLAGYLGGTADALLMRTHVLPNVLGPVLVIATLNLGFAILAEATLSFLGVGVPPTQPSLGTLIRIGNDFLMSGEWWITIFPGVALVAMVLSVNLLGDWLRDALN